MARLLAAPGGGVRPPERDIPADYRRAILELAKALQPSMSAAGREAARVAERLLAEIERCDKELGAFARDAGPAEVDRLSVQLGALGEPSVVDSNEHRELRELVQHQLRLVHRMQARRELISQRRAHLFHLMRGLWTKLGVLQNTVDDQSGRAPAAMDEVLAACAEVEAEIEVAGTSVPDPTLSPTPVGHVQARAIDESRSWRPRS